MSFRIEHTDPITLLRELPDGLAQTCVTAPRRDTPIPYLLAVLDEVHRVLRSDGTLWLSLTRGGNSHELKLALKDTRWRDQTRRSRESSCCLTSSPSSAFTRHNPRPRATRRRVCSVLATPSLNGRGTVASAARCRAVAGVSRHPALRGYRHAR